MKFTDSHCHLDFPELQNDIASLLAQCQAQNIHRLIVPAVSPSNWSTVLASCTSHQTSCQLLPCLGIHPWYLQTLNASHLEQLSAEIQQHQNIIIAIGETGVDGVIAKEHDNLSQQQWFFEYHISLAKQFSKPLIVHHRRSHQAVIETLKHTNYTGGGIIHAFSGSYQQGKTYIDMGFKLGIGGTITYPRAEKFHFSRILWRFHHLKKQADVVHVEC